MLYLYNIYRSLTQHIGSTCKTQVEIQWYYTTYRCMVYLENIHTIFTKHNSILRSIWIYIKQLLVSFWESAWSFVIIPLHSLLSTIQNLAESPHECDYVNNPLSPIMSHPHSRNVWIFSEKEKNPLWTNSTLLKTDFVSSFRLLNHCRGIFSSSDMRIANLPHPTKWADHGQANPDWVSVHADTSRALLLVSFKSFGCNTWVLGYSSFVRKPLRGVNGFLQVLNIK